MIWQTESSVKKKIPSIFPDKSPVVIQCWQVTHKSNKTTKRLIYDQDHLTMDNEISGGDKLVL